MKAAVIYGKEDVRVEEVRTQPLKPGEARIRIEAALTCGTDLKVFRRGYHAKMIVPPAVFGHELAGVISEVHPSATDGGPGGWRVGDRVVAANSAPCGTCFFCLHGQENLCDDLLFLNGAYAESIVVASSPPWFYVATAEPLALILLLSACGSAPATSVNSNPAPTDTLAAPTTVANTETAIPTDTPVPPTAIPTASRPFQLVSRDEVCNPNLTGGLMQISILDSHRHQMPGVEIDISWAGGDESFFTGLKPEIADGYADYVMQAGLTYSIRVEHAGTPVSDLSAPSCPESGGQTYLGGLKLVFQQP